MNNSFLEAVLPPQGPYCAVGITSGRLQQTFHATIPELAAKVASNDAAGLESYFAVAAFNSTATRTAVNVRELRAFFLDLDVGPTKGYKSQPEALVALRQFVDETGLPSPYIINSGGGVHVYWPLTEAIPGDQWKTYAEALKRLCHEKGLHADDSCTADRARILRPVGTYNQKYSPARPVTSFTKAPASELGAIVSCLPQAVDLSLAREYGPDAMTRALAQGDDYPSTEFARIVRRSAQGTGCHQILHAVQNAATLEEPLWRAALSIAIRCTDSEKAIHKLSSAHPEYNPDATRRKAEATAGPMTCEWYRSNYGAICNGCSQPCVSPISLGRIIEAAPSTGTAYVVQQQLEPDNNPEPPQTVQVEIPVYPFPYFRGTNGGVYMRSRDKDSGDPLEVEIYRQDLYVTNRFYDAEDGGSGEGEIVTVNLHTPHDGIRSFTAPVAALLTKEKMRDILLKNGVVAIDKELTLIMAYLAASIRNLQKQFAADRARNQMGWTPDETSFVIGELEYTATNTRLAPATAATRLVAPMLTSTGRLEEWTHMVNFYNRPGMEAHALAVFFGFGAPLLRLMGGIEVRGATINLMSNKSGTGKTTAQMIVNSIFGHPSELLLKKSDTTNGKAQWLGMMNTLPVTMDEVTNIADDQLSELIYDIPQGRGKHRMEAQTNRLRSNVVSWTTFVIMSSNSSLYDKLSRHKSTADGEMRRLIELRVARPADISKEESDAVFGALPNNYGLAGPVFMKYVLQNRMEVEALLQKFKDRIDKDLNLNQSDRFYSTVLACAFAGATLAQRLQLFQMDLRRIYQYTMGVLGNIREEVIAPASDVEAAAEEALITYINENINNALVVNSTRPGMAPQAPITSPRGPLRLRYEPDTSELWLPSTALRDLFVARQIDSRQATQELAARGILKYKGQPQNKRLNAGCLGSFESTTQRCICIDGSALSFNSKAFSEDETTA